MGLLRGLGRFAKAVPNVGHDAGLAGADTVLGTAGGMGLGALSAAGNPDDMTANTLAGGMLGGGIAGGVGVKRMIMALAREMKKARPDAPDEQVLKAAEQAVKQKMGMI